MSPNLPPTFNPPHDFVLSVFNPLLKVIKLSSVSYHMVESESHNINGTLFRLLLKTVLASVCFVACGTLAVLTIVEALAAEKVGNAGGEGTRGDAPCLQGR